MITLDFVSGKTYGLLGLGRTGLATARALIKAGAVVIAWDDKEDSRTAAAAEGLTIRDLTMAIAEIDALIASPGVPFTHPAPHPAIAAAHTAHIPITSDIALLRAALPEHDFIGITGTNGKSTTTALLGHVLSAFYPTLVGGNIGTAVLDMPMPQSADTKVVLELSSYQLDLTPALQPRGGIWLNLTPDHLDRHGDMDGYAAAKAKLFHTAPDGAPKPLAIIGVDDDYGRALAETVAAEGFFTVVRLRTGSYLEDGYCVLNDHLYYNGQEMMALAGLPALRGLHNQQNAACVVILLHALYGIPLSEIAPHLFSFGGLPHRQFMVRKINDVAYINDSKATNAEATAKALGAFDDIYWILGGQAKTSGLDGLDDFMPRIRHAYLIGEATERFAAWLSARNVPFTRADVMGEAVTQAHKQAQSDAISGKGAGVVLLSPACASWDQYKSYEHRGDDFAAHVGALAHVGEGAL